MNGGGNSGNFSHRAPLLATDMRCYFGCPEGFKKEADFRLHLKLRHRNENEDELRKAYQHLEEEIALVCTSASTYQCALCPKKFNNQSTFWEHVTKRDHKMQWIVYKEQFGNCEVESAPFECKICGRVIKYIRHSITDHLRLVHKINWELYVDRIRKMRAGYEPDKLPDIDYFQCKICSASVKYATRRDHLKRTHKITEPEYAELFQGEGGQVKNEPNNSGHRSYPNKTNSPGLQNQNSINNHNYASHEDSSSQLSSGYPQNQYRGDENNNVPPNKIYNRNGYAEPSYQN